MYHPGKVWGTLSGYFDFSKPDRSDMLAWKCFRATYVYADTVKK